MFIPIPAQEMKTMIVKNQKNKTNCIEQRNLGSLKTNV